MSALFSTYDSGNSRYDSGDARGTRIEGGDDHRSTTVCSIEEQLPEAVRAARYGEKITYTKKETITIDDK